MVASEVPSPCPISDPNDFYSVALVSALCEVINNMIIRGGGSALASIALESPILLQSDRRHKLAWDNSTEKWEEPREANSDDRFIRFQSSETPAVTVRHYLQRIQKYSKCSDSCLLLVLVYLDRIVAKKQLRLTELNVHRFLISGILLAAKFHDDLYYNNAFYAKLGGISLEELNKLELEMLGLLDFSLLVKVPLFEQYSAAIDRVICTISAPSSPFPQPSSSSSIFSLSSFSPVSSPAPSHLHHVHHSHHRGLAFTTNAVIPQNSIFTVTAARQAPLSTVVFPRAQHSTSHLELILDTTSTTSAASSCLSLHSARHSNLAGGSSQASECRQRPAPGLHSLWSFDSDASWDLRGSDMSFSFDRPEDQLFAAAPSRSCSQLSISAFSSHSSLSSASPGPIQQRSGCPQPPGLVPPHAHPARTASYPMHVQATKQSTRGVDAGRPVQANYFRHHGPPAANHHHNGGTPLRYPQLPQPDLVNREFQQQQQSLERSRYSSSSLASDSVSCRGRRGGGAERFVEPTASPNNIDHHHGSFHGSSPSPSWGFDFPPQQQQFHPRQLAQRHGHESFMLGDGSSDECFEFSQVYNMPEEPSFFAATPKQHPPPPLHHRNMPDLVSRDVYMNMQQQQRSRGHDAATAGPAHWAEKKLQQAAMTSHERGYRQSAHPSLGHSGGFVRISDFEHGMGGGVKWPRCNGPPPQQFHSHSHWAMNMPRPQQPHSHSHAMLGVGAEFLRMHA